MGPFIFLVLIMVVKSESVESEGSPTLGESSDSSMRVCQQHIIINPPVCSRPPPMSAGIGCNCSTIQHIASTAQTVTRQQLGDLLKAVSGNQESVSSELKDTRREVGELQAAVSTNQKVVTSELKNTTQQCQDTRRQVEDLQEIVSGNQEIVTSEVRGIRRQLEKLQALVELLLNTSSMNQARTTVDSTDRTATTEAVALPKDCSEILARGVSISGVYTVQPLDSGRAFQVFCDMETDGGGWTVFQRRKDGSVDFYLDFANYSQGFGNLEGEFWLGNDNLHRLTAQGDYELRVDLSDFEDESRFAVYDSFSIADVSDSYRLTVGSYSGTAGDSLIRHNNHQFSTKDRDNDDTASDCANLYHGAWWYDACHESNLNGAYLRGTTTEYARGVVWRYWKEYHYSLKTTEMKIRASP